MPAETPPPTPAPPPPPQKPAQPSSAGLIAVGVVAVAALVFGAYAAFLRSPEPVPTSSRSTVTVSSADVENRLAALEQKRTAQERRLTALEDDVAKLEKKSAAAAAPPPPTTTTPPTTPASSATDAPAPGAAPAESARPATMAAVSAPPTNPDGASGGAFHVVPNAELKGRLGRIVVTFPAGTKASGARADIFKSGDAKAVRTEWGDFGIEMTPGTYDLNINGHLVPGVVVKTRSDTRVHVGVLRTNASAQTRFDLFEPGAQNAFGTYWGQNDIGLPPGRYDIEVSGQRETVTIASGGITEY
jgi:uncharacterized coiled-coil protein SlyX